MFSIGPSSEMATSESTSAIVRLKLASTRFAFPAVLTMIPRGPVPVHRMRKIYFWSWCILQARVLRIRDDADYFEVCISRPISCPLFKGCELYPLTDGIFVPEIIAFECLIDDGYMSS